MSMQQRARELDEQPSELQIRRINGYIGAEISGVDLSRELDEGTFARIKAAMLEHGVLVFRNQPLTPVQQQAFSSRFGEAMVHPYLKGLDDAPAVHQVIKTPEAEETFGGVWHADFSNLKVPGGVNLLYGVQTPPYGGDTAFCSTAAAYDHLSPELRDKVDGLNAWHGYSDAYKANYADNKIALDLREDFEPVEGEDVLHSVVRTHPETGRKSLYVNPHFTLRIDGMGREESAALLDELHGHILRPDFGLRVAWEDEMLTLWDNAQVLHYAANDYPGHLRVMHRVLTLEQNPTI